MSHYLFSFESQSLLVTTYLSIMHAACVSVYMYVSQCACDDKLKVEGVGECGNEAPLCAYCHPICAWGVQGFFALCRSLELRRETMSLITPNIQSVYTSALLAL